RCSAEGLQREPYLHRCQPSFLLRRAMEEGRIGGWLITLDHHRAGRELTLIDPDTPLSVAVDKAFANRLYRRASPARPKPLERNTNLLQDLVRTSGCPRGRAAERPSQVANPETDGELQRPFLGDVTYIDNLAVVAAHIDDHRHANTVVQLVGVGAIREM